MVSVARDLVKRFGGLQAVDGMSIALARANTVPAAVRLGRRGDPVEAQSRLARAILRDHLICLAAIATVLALQLSFAT